MAQQQFTSVENNFTQGLKTEYTGLNFPENAATDTDNCIYHITGNVTRRDGFNFETNYNEVSASYIGKAKAQYRWDNVGGDGMTQFVVCQLGDSLQFYGLSISTDAYPLSKNLIYTVSLNSYAISGQDPSSYECQFSDGNGYLFVYNAVCDTIAISYVGGNFTVTPINLQIRDFVGISDGLNINNRPSVLSAEHTYNLFNQGWTVSASWTSQGNNLIYPTGGVKSLTIGTGLAITNGDILTINATAYTHDSYDADFGHWKDTYTNYSATWTGTVTSYTSGTGALTLNVFSVSSVGGNYFGNASTVLTGTQSNIHFKADGLDFYYAISTYYVTSVWSITKINLGYTSTWYASQGNYPSNADVWWRFKNSSGVFDPATRQPYVSLSTGAAPKGRCLIGAFQQKRALVSGVNGITDVTTTQRPKTGTWHQGRVWYTGLDSSVAANGNAPYTSWTENIYFSQIIESSADFGKCYQKNDPTDENLFDLLPTDGGVINIQGCGVIYKLFSIQNGILVFAANGIWFITGSKGIGFSADDYTVTKISSVRSISASSIVNVQGLPYFWNEEGIYTIQASQQGLGLTVEPITVGTILSFYDEIPKANLRYVKGDYHPIDYTIQWVFKSEFTTDVTSRYEYDRVLVYNVYNKAFYPYTINQTVNTPKINGVLYVSSSNQNSPLPGFKYFVSYLKGSTQTVTFAEENDHSMKDWKARDGVGLDYDSYFITGYKIVGQGQRKFQVGYLSLFSNSDEPTGYKVRSIWDYTNNTDSGRYSREQTVTNGRTNFGVLHNRHRIRGQGVALQFNVTSYENKPFDIIGWSVWGQQNASP